MNENVTERKGMKLLSTSSKRMPNGKCVTMARIRCSCDREFKATLSRWNHGLFDSCRNCGLRRAKNKGYGIFNGGRNLGR